ncbi:MAG: VPLPA-CTERM sorting domain-containing protein [Oceanicoccus sp.]|uniref:VPLPA-CTERM sorting domain-containing protein n=1 Tax=Oceanicoccus sp. TaxID=2691044 RepID=UPI00261E26BA|nr:VPLPA-CTERM sorting domain-containing protein [Oceanicoccus sp.]MCP3908411.1 VPLPA-CTERM sorting domain-containing protein [Oceanicoccus sp.]
MSRLVVITLATVLGLVSAVGQASPVTIDFESLAAGDVTGPDVDGFSTFSTDGFDFLVKGGLGDVGGNQYASSIHSGNFFEPGTLVSFSRTDNSAFALLDLDILQCQGACTIWGGINGGSSISTTNVNDLGTGDWLNLSSAEVYGGTQISPPITYALDVDNIVVASAVPVPAAVWLFGSALAGLGRMRRKQVA